MTKKYIILPLLLVPIVVNFICAISCPWTVGDSETWIGFWGGYLGALVAFYAIYANIEFNQNENKKARTYEYNDKLRRDIVESLSSLDITRIAKTVTKTDNGELDKIDSPQLEAYENEVIIKYNTFLILYDGVCDPFIEHYEKVQDKLASAIIEIIKMYNISVEHYNSQTREEAKSETESLIRNIDNLQPVIDELWEDAKALVKEYKTKD